MFIVLGEHHGAGVEDKGQSTKGDTRSGPEHVVCATGDKEADDISDGGGGDGEVLSCGGVLSSVADRRHCVEHSYGAEAYDTDQNDLAHGLRDHGGQRWEESARESWEGKISRKRMARKKSSGTPGHARR